MPRSPFSEKRSLNISLQTTLHRPFLKHALCGSFLKYSEHSDRHFVMNEPLFKTFVTVKTNWEHEVNAHKTTNSKSLSISLFLRSNYKKCFRVVLGSELPWLVKSLVNKDGLAEWFGFTSKIKKKRSCFTEEKDKMTNGPENEKGMFWETSLKSDWWKKSPVMEMQSTWVCPRRVIKTEIDLDISKFGSIIGQWKSIVRFGAGYWHVNKTSVKFRSEVIASRQK